MRQEENGYQEQENTTSIERQRKFFQRKTRREPDPGNEVDGVLPLSPSLVFAMTTGEREREKRSLEQNQARVVLFGSILPSLVNGGGVHVTSSLAFLSFLATHVVSFPDSLRYHH